MMVKVKVSYLGSLIEITGRNEEELELKDNSKLGDLFEALKEKYGAEFAKYFLEVIGEVEGTTFILINGRTVRKHKEFLAQSLSEHDFLSIVPFYSGG